jgi:hypothetical protein
MVEGRHLDLGPLQGPEAALDHHEAFVPLCSIFEAQGVVIGLQDPLAVILGRLPDRSAVHPDLVAFGHPEIALEAEGGQQINGPLGGGIGPGVPVEFFFEGTYDLSSAFLLPFRFLGVVAEDIAPSPFAVSHHDLLGVEVVLNDIVSAPLSQDLMLDLGDGSHAGGEQVLSAGPGQFFPVVLRVHTGIGYKDGPAQLPAPQIGTHLLHRAHVSGVAGQDPTLDGKAFRGHRKGHHVLSPSLMKEFEGFYCQNKVTGGMKGGK